MGIELQGIERVSPQARSDRNLWGNLTLWLSANLTVSTPALGALAIPLFKLGFTDSLAAIVVFNLLAVVPVGLLATLGPRLGLRQMTISRFSFGWKGAQLMALFNIAACIGWSAVNAVVGAQLLAALSGMPVGAGILLLAALTTPVSLYGYRYVHAYERFAWIPMAAVFGLIAVRCAGSFQAPPPGSWAAFFAFGSAVFGYAAGWAPYAADYNVNQPEDAPPRSVFALTACGILLPCICLETLGVALTTVPAFRQLGGGALLAAAVPHPVLSLFLALSVVATNIPNDYSLGLCIQLLGRRFSRVPRHLWTVFGAILYTALAIPAASHFSETLTDFLLVIGYWLAPWATILLLEHLVFRRGVYPVDDWNAPERLPSGFAALAALAMGLVGVGLGASQALYTGPLARALGTDVGFELAVLLAALTYLPLRRSLP